MKRSRAVTIGATIALLTTQLAGSCDDEEYTEVQTAYGEICVRQPEPPATEPVRVNDDECERGERGRSFIWINHGYGGGYASPRVGESVRTGAFTTVKPTNTTIARPPASGGFGTFRAPIGG